jgi:hypothetical protein
VAIPTAPIPTLKNLTENWIRTYVRDGPVAFSMLLHSKTLTQGSNASSTMYDPIRNGYNLTVVGKWHS